MTNEQIIWGERLDLMNKGIIGTTGKMITLENEKGEKFDITEPEAIYTYQAWKSLGYQVKRGQKAKAAFSIWKLTRKKAKEEKDVDVEKMFMVKAFFFTLDQVDAIKEE